MNSVKFNTSSWGNIYKLWFLCFCLLAECAKTSSAILRSEFARHKWRVAFRISGNTIPLTLQRVWTISNQIQLFTISISEASNLMKYERAPSFPDVICTTTWYSMGLCWVSTGLATPSLEYLLTTFPHRYSHGAWWFGIWMSLLHSIFYYNAESMDHGFHTKSGSVHALPLMSMQLLGIRKEIQPLWEILSSTIAYYIWKARYSSIYHQIRGSRVEVVCNISFDMVHTLKGQWYDFNGDPYPKFAQCLQFISLWKDTPHLSCKGGTLIDIFNHQVGCSLH